MVPVGTPVVLRHRMTSIPPLVRGHGAVFRGVEKQAEQPKVPLLNLDTWLGSGGPGSIRLCAKRGWYRTLGPEEVAQQTYVRRQVYYDPIYTERIVPFQAAWKQLNNFLWSVYPQDRVMDITNLWGCYTAADLAEVLDLHLSDWVQADLAQRWVKLLDAHEVLLFHHVSALGWK